MSSLTEIQMDIAASLWGKPAIFEQLMERDFLKHRSEHGIAILLQMMDKKGWIYQKGRIYFTYQSTVIKILNPEGYELDDGIREKSDFRKAFDKFNKQFG